MLIVKRANHYYFFMLSFAILFSVSATKVYAQLIEVQPPYLDFGEVVVGNTATASFRILSAGFQPLTVTEITLTDDPNDVFFFEEFLLNGTTLLTGVPPSQILLPNEFLDVTVGFLPELPGINTAAIRIDSNAEPPNDLFLVQLRGIGADSVAVAEPPIFVLLSIGLAGLGIVRRRMNI
jgi:hypothetical protein